MKKVIIFTLALLIALTLGGCGVSVDQVSPNQNNASNGTLVFSLSGSGNKTSETFYITSEDWYIDWNYQGSRIGATIYLYPEGAIPHEDLFIDSFGSNIPRDNRIHFHNQMGGFYLRVLAKGEWEIEVYE